MNPKYSPQYRLSSTGSERGTAYIQSNKIVTLGNRTFVVWTDRNSVTMGNVFHYDQQAWDTPIELGIGADNHNTPALTADASGRLHLAYGPHGVWGIYPDQWPGGTFKFVAGATPGSFNGMRESTGSKYPFGYRATYAALLHVPPGVDCLVCRGGEHPPALMFHRRTAHGGWTNALPLMAQDIPPQYTYQGAMLTADIDGILYVAGAFYGGERLYSLGVAALKSTDLGRTWTDLNGRPADLPIMYGDRFAVPHSEPHTDPRINGLTVDPARKLWALTCSRSILDRQLLLSQWLEDRWKTTDIAVHIPQEWVPFESHLTIDTRGGLHLAVVAIAAEARKEDRDPLANWGHPSSEIFHLYSDDGGRSFVCRQISEPDPEQPNWLPSISVNGPYHPVDRPVIMYTHGKEKDRTEIKCVFVR